ncbi:hypothetical protein MASR1M36_16150 [Candidatus Cloacimonadaceae bacterium]
MARPRKKVYIETEPTGDEAQSEESTPTFEATDVTVEESVRSRCPLDEEGESIDLWLQGARIDWLNGIVENIIVTPCQCALTQ